MRFTLLPLISGILFAGIFFQLACAFGWFGDWVPFAAFGGGTIICIGGYFMEAAQ